MNTYQNITYSIPEQAIRLAQEIAISLVQEQKRIQLEQKETKNSKNKDKKGKEDKGLSTELSKLITYLDYKIRQKQQNSAKFLIYLKKLIESSKNDEIGHSKTTPLYYESLYKVCKHYLKNYKDKPLLVLQILAWSQRLMDYILNVNPDFQPDIVLTDEAESTLEEFHHRLNHSPKVKSVKNNPIETLEFPTKSETEALATLKFSPQPPKPKPISPKPIQSKQIVNPPTRPNPPTKSVEKTKPEPSKPKASEPPNPFKRPPK